MSQISRSGSTRQPRARRFRSACSRCRRARAAAVAFAAALAAAAAAQPQVVHRADPARRDGRGGRLRAADRHARPDGLLAAGREAVALDASLLRHDRPGHRRLLAGRARHALVALPRPGRRHGRDRPGGDARHPRGLQRRLGRRSHQLRDQRLPRDPHDPAADRRLRLHQEPRVDLDDPDPGLHAVGVRGAHPARTGADAAQSRLHPGRQGGRRADPAHRLLRVDAEHGQPYRGGFRARLLRLHPDRRRPRVPRSRRSQHPELGGHALLGPGQLDRAPGRVVAIPVPGRRARADGGRSRPDSRGSRRGLEPAAAKASRQRRGMLTGMLFGHRRRS